LLFCVQRFGTGRIGSTFAPIIILWLLMLAGFGIYNLVKYDAGVFKAFNPGEAFMYLIRHGKDGWRSLGGVLLCFTGVEALFADLGAFSMRAIQISWLCYCLPCLLLTYIGQAAYIAAKPDGYANPVFLTAPPNWKIPALVLAILASIVASQAIITATFQLLSQIIKLSYFPQIQVIHTSKVHHNQLYVPLANYLLCIGTVAIAAGFQNTTSLGNAYGACVMFVTFFDTCMTTMVAILVWRIPAYYVVLPALTIACMDGAYLSSALEKVPKGAYITLVMATVLASILILWHWGKENQWAAEREDRKPLQEFLSVDDEGSYRLVGQGGAKGGEVLAINKGFGVFFDKAGLMTPMVFSQYINKLASSPEVIVFFHMRPLEYPTVPSDERFVVSQIKFLPNCYRVICRHGFMDEIVTPDLASLIYDHVQKYVMDKARTVAPQPVRSPSPVQLSRTIAFQESQLDEKTEKKTDNDKSEKASTAQVGEVSDIIGKEEMHVKAGTNFWRRGLLNTFLFFRDNTRSKMANLKVPTDRLVEIGFLKEV
jgi:KUP system potassium uptake protein